MSTAADLGVVSRRLRDLVEPIAAQVYFAPEAHAGYEELGLDFFEGYFCSRGACLGRAPWTVICATFGVFKPAAVEAAVTAGWEKTGPEPVLAARQHGAEAQLQRVLGHPDASVGRATEILSSLTEGLDRAGRPIFAGLSALAPPQSAWGRLWRAADLVRERRGDAHVGAWIQRYDACEVSVVTELAWGLDPRAYVYTRGWDEAEVDAANERLRARGVLEPDADALTPEGARERADVERATDRAEHDVVDRLGDRADELSGLLESWAQALCAARAYPVHPASLRDVRAS